ncbi:MAG: right-handed parallel beta-helix repeat-containing protein [Azonexus sp.]|nr:right-handed parallel beta-helix repeat-containing protein [Azonexus sp.]
MLRLIFLHSLALLSAGVQAAQPLQPWIDLTPAGQTLRLPPGVYDGPGHINKPITITGNQQAIIDGGGQGTILILNGDDIQIKGLTLRNSGDSHDALDGAIRAQGKRLLIEDNRIEAVLFGITLHQVEDSVVRRNSIRSRKAQDAAERGDALRLWNSVRNRIEDNEIAQTRDITVSNSPRNRFTGNRIHDSRRAFNFLFSHRSVVDRNTLTNNSSGIVALNSDGMLIRNNRIMHAMEASGAGIALKEISAALIQGNEIVHCAHGIMADSSTHPFNRIVFIDNLIAMGIRSPIPGGITPGTTTRALTGIRTGSAIHRTKFTPLPTASGLKRQPPAFFAMPRCWSCSTFSNAWRHFLPQPCYSGMRRRA